MFKACFVAKVDKSRSSAQIFCQYRNKELGVTTTLPSPEHLGSFCYPLGVENVKPQEYAAPEEYSFTLTGGDGSHLHGFCRSFLPPRGTRIEGQKNANLRYPQILCLISPFPWFPFYFKILQCIEALLKQGDLLKSSAEADLPVTSSAALFMNTVLQECRGKPQLGRIVRVPFPQTANALNVSPQRRINGLDNRHGRPLQSNPQSIELQIPPDTGNGSWNAGIPLARLFWHLPSGSLMALLQAILLERRILMVAQERDTLSAAVHTVSALLYPFRWQHIYLPLLPHSLKDYLTAPMPYLIGVPAPQMLLGLRNLALEDIVYVDLDAGSCTAGGPAGPPLDFSLLPWAHQLQAAFQIVYQMLRSPTEFESTPVIGHCLQEYFLKLLGTYREYIEVEHFDSEEEGSSAEPPGTRQHIQDDGYLRFDHLSFVANHRRSEKARNFLDMLRHSQMYEVFINERLALAAGGFKSSDAFEAKVSFLQGKRGKVLGRLVAQASAKGVSNLSAVLQRTSTLVKSGVAQIRHGHSPSEDGAATHQHGAADTIVPSYSIDLESPRVQPRVEASASLQRPVPHKGEDPSAFFNHDPDADDDAPPEHPPSRPVSPLRAPHNRPASPQPISPKHIPSAAFQPAQLSSPRSSGITRGGDGFDALLNLDGVEGVFSSPAGAKRETSLWQATASLMDEDGPLEQPQSAFASSPWSTSAPSASEPAVLAPSRAGSIPALVLSFDSSVTTRSTEPSPAASVLRQHSGPGFALGETAALGSIDPFQEFQSPEAMRASSNARNFGRAPRAAASEPGHEPHFPAAPRAGNLHQRAAQRDQLHGSSRGSSFDVTALRTSSGGLAVSPLPAGAADSRFVVDPFSKLDPITRQTSGAPMARVRNSWSAEGGRPTDEEASDAARGALGLGGRDKAQDPAPSFQELQRRASEDLTAAPHADFSDSEQRHKHGKSLLDL